MSSGRAAQRAARWMATPAIGWLLLTSLLPLAMTLYYSVLDYRLLEPGGGFVGLKNYVAFVTNPTFFGAILRTLVLVAGVLALTIGPGILVALLLDRPIRGQGVLRMLIISPFFVMPAVSALLWKNLLMNPVSGLFASLARGAGVKPFDWLGDAPLLSIIIMVAWTWLPFASLIFITSLQSVDGEQLDAAILDGASAPARFRYIVLPHLSRPIAVVVLVETIFLLAVFAEIYVTTSGGPGEATTTLSFLIFAEALLRFDIGAASAGGVVALVLANVVALVLARLVAPGLAEH